jgi:D-amino peptidase
MIVVIGALALLSQAGGAQAPRKLKVHISVDMEGIAGVVTNEQLGPQGFEYQRFREFMTREALAAVNAAKEAGATQIVVADSHGNGQNLLIDQFPPDVRVIRSWPRRLGMMAGIDETFDAAIFIGYHAAATDAAGVRAHTFSSATLTEVKLNGRSVSEAMWNAAIAGHFRVPVVMLSGDDVIVRETQRALGQAEGAAVKRALSFHSAETMTPQAACELIAQKVKAGLARRGEWKPYTMAAPVTLEITFQRYRPAEALAFLPGVERTAARTVRFTAKNMLEAADFMQFVTTYNSTLDP